LTYRWLSSPCCITACEPTGRIGWLTNDDRRLATGDQVRPPAEEDGKDPNRGEDQQEEKVKPPLVHGQGAMQSQWTEDHG
jgi:hypothetical protein